MGRIFVLFLHLSLNLLKLNRQQIKLFLFGLHHLSQTHFFNLCCFYTKLSLIDIILIALYLLLNFLNITLIFHKKKYLHTIFQITIICLFHFTLMFQRPHFCIHFIPYMRISFLIFIRLMRRDKNNFQLQIIKRFKSEFIAAIILKFFLLSVVLSIWFFSSSSIAWFSILYAPNRLLSIFYFYWQYKWLHEAIIANFCVHSLPFDTILTNFHLT